MESCGAENAGRAAGQAKRTGGSAGCEGAEPVQHCRCRTERRSNVPAEAFHRGPSTSCDGNRQCRQYAGGCRASGHRHSSNQSCHHRKAGAEGLSGAQGHQENQGAAAHRQGKSPHHRDARRNPITGNDRRLGNKAAANRAWRNGTERIYDRDQYDDYRTGKEHGNEKRSECAYEKQNHWCLPQLRCKCCGA